MNTSDLPSPVFKDNSNPLERRSMMAKRMSH